MRVLITNDDGISSEGLRTLAATALAQQHDVVVAAPSDEASGSSAALTAVQSAGRIVVERRTLPGTKSRLGVRRGRGAGVHRADRHPRRLRRPSDAVLSGINRGANVGNAILHSGTVGAALTKRTQGRQGLAVSLARCRAQQLRRRRRRRRHQCPLAHALHEPVVLNVNVPDLPPAEVRGIRRARLAGFGVAEISIAEVGEGWTCSSGSPPGTSPSTSPTPTPACWRRALPRSPPQPICEREDVNACRSSAPFPASAVRERSHGKGAPRPRQVVDKALPLPVPLVVVLDAQQ